jgi:hypothetical protein
MCCSVDAANGGCPQSLCYTCGNLLALLGKHRCSHHNGVSGYALDASSAVTSTTTSSTNTATANTQSGSIDVSIDTAAHSLTSGNALRLSVGSSNGVLPSSIGVLPSADSCEYECYNDFDYGGADSDDQFDDGHNSGTVQGREPNDGQPNTDIMTDAELEFHTYKHVSYNKALRSIMLSLPCVSVHSLFSTSPYLTKALYARTPRTL